MSWDRELLEQQRKESFQLMASDQDLREIGKEFLKRSYRVDYCYQWDWLGFPILQMPEDVVAYQEIIFRTQPTLVIETGIAWGGSVALAASILSLLPGERRVLGIDLNLDPNLESSLASLGLSTKIDLWAGNSTEQKLLGAVGNYVSADDSVMVVLDSHHTHEHVLSELRSYSAWVSPGNYLIVGDTSVEFLAEETDRARPWTVERNPHSAVEEFLSEQSTFERDPYTNSKLQTSFHPGGYLVHTS